MQAATSPMTTMPGQPDQGAVATPKALVMMARVPRCAIHAQVLGIIVLYASISVSIQT